jgi:hypothetical protein
VSAIAGHRGVLAAGGMNDLVMCVCADLDISWCGIPLVDPLQIDYQLRTKFLRWG